MKNYISLMQTVSEKFFDAFSECMLSESRDRFEDLDDLILDSSYTLKKRFGSLSENTNGDNAQLFQDTGYEFNHKGLPVYTVISQIESYKSQCVLAAGNQSLESSVNDIEKLIDDMKDALLKGYLLRDLEEYECLYVPEIDQNPYINPHLGWISKLIHEIRTSMNKDDMDISEMKKEFSQWINRPESRIILGDEYEWVTILHNSIYSLVNDIIFFFPHRNYLQIIVLFKDLQKKIFYLMHTLNELYKSFMENSDSRIIRYLKSVEDDARYDVYLITLTNLNIIEKLWGNRIAQEFINQVTQELDVYKEQFLGYSFYLKTGRSEFVFFNEITDKSSMKNVLYSMQTVVSRTSVGSDSSEIDGKVVVASISGEKVKEMSRHVMKNLFNHLREMSVDQGTGIISTGEDNHLKIVEQMNKDYRDVIFIDSVLREQKLDVFFQPVFNMNSNKIYDLEALVRIVLDKGETIAANDFIDTVYRMERIERLDSIVFVKVRDYISKVKKLTDKLFINASPSSLKSPQFRKIMIDTVEQFKKNGLEIVIELTEQAVLDNIDIVEYLKDKFGLMFAVDDFGTGYSSLKTVASLSQKQVISHLKIDGSLIRDVVDSKSTFDIVTTIAKMTTALNLNAISEYVEDERIVNKLKEVGLIYGQGFHFSKPCHIDELLSINKLH